MCFDLCPSKRNKSVIVVEERPGALPSNFAECFHPFVHNFYFLSEMIPMLNPARLGTNCGFVVDWRECSNMQLLFWQLGLPLQIYKRS